MKTGIIVLLALSVAGCQSRRLSQSGGTLRTSLGAAGFPIGTYTNCAQGTHNPTGNLFLNVAGFQSGAVLTLAQSGTTVTSKYVDQNGNTQSLSFSTTTGTSATLAKKAQVIGGFTGLCVTGPGNTAPYPASMTATTGALTYNAGAVFLTLTGRLRSDAGACGTLSAPDASFWIVCRERNEGALPGIDAEPQPVAPLPAGQYSCRSQVESYQQVKGIGQYVGGGGSGTLTVTQDRGQVIADYTRDSSVSGMLRLRSTTPTTASVDAGQMLQTRCMGTTGSSPTAEMLRVAAGSLTMHDSTIFLSFAGAMASSSTCPGAQVVGSVICARARR
jgi:hypothetical protein